MPMVFGKSDGISCVVVTGGPCSGKTTVLSRLKRKKWFQKQGIIVPEVATDLITRYQLHEDDFAALRNPGFVLTFQRSILAETLLRKKIAFERAKKDGKTLIVLDRGPLDGVVYVGGMHDFLWSMQLPVVKMIEDIRAVLHLAQPPIQHYVKNSVRKEGYEEALALGEGVLNAWKASHLPVFTIDGGTMDEKYKIFLETLRELAY